MAIKLSIQNEIDDLEVTLGQTPVILGRSGSCSVKINDDQISGKHCAIKVSSTNRVLVKDLGTTNGSYLNESIVTDTNLMIGDVFRIGETKLKIATGSLTPSEKKALTKEDGLTKVRYMSLPSGDEKKSFKTFRSN